MVKTDHTWLALISKAPYQILLPLIAGGAMLGASLLPWLTDPLGENFSAWHLPVDIGWQVHVPLFTYGLLCFCCALLCFLIAASACRELIAGQALAREIQLHRNYQTATLIRPTRLQAFADFINTNQGCALVGLLCLVPMALFFIQYLYIDMGSIALLANHEMQAMLVKAHFGYGTATQFMPIQIATFNPATLHGRLSLVLDQLNPGFFVPCLCALLLLSARSLYPNRPRVNRQRSRRRTLLLIAAVFALLLIVLGRAPAALLSKYQAEHLLTTSDYNGALKWLDYARKLNPSLSQLAEYNVERGQARYYLNPGDTSLESRAYLSSFYRQQNDYLSSYQELLGIVASRQNAPWIIDELNTTLERSAEQVHPLNGQPAQRVPIEEPSLTWLNNLLHLDPTNVYAHYMLGRIHYDLHDYVVCSDQMRQVINLSTNTDIQSSAYTYLGLSSAGQGQYVAAHDYFFMAQDLDPEFRNNTAREEISGLR